MAAKKAAEVKQITLHDHIKELRNRFFAVAIVFVIVSAVAYNYKDILIHYLLQPLGDEKLIYLNPAGGFSFIFQVTMYVGIAVAVPFLVYNLYRFVAPALPEKAQKHSLLVMLSSLILLCIGVAFGYFIAIPGALTFLNSFADGYVIPSLTADSYLNFVLAYTAGLGILFQLPLVLLLVHWVHPLKPGGLLKFERYMILIAFVAAAMITPTPDVMNQLVIALPIIVMYQLGVIAIVISIVRAKRRARAGVASPIAKPLKKPKRVRSRSLYPDIEPMGGIQELVAELEKPEPVTPAVTLQPEVVSVDTELMEGEGDQIKPAVVEPLKVIDEPIVVAAPAVVPASQTWRSMDIMMAPAPKQRSGNLVPPVKRPVPARTAGMQVPLRSQPALNGKGIHLDGIYRPAEKNMAKNLLTAS